MSRSRAFTLVEVLISLVVLLVAFAGILSLLLASTRQAGQVVEDTFASTLARSVYESVRAGVRERSFAAQVDGGHVVRGLVLTHAGVADGSPPPAVGPAPGPEALATLKASDAVIFLPASPGATPGAEPPEPTFVFPRPGGVADNDGVPHGKDNARAVPLETDWGRVDLEVARVYGSSAPASEGEGSPGETVTEAAPVSDAREQYGFAVVVRRASTPPLLDEAGEPLDWKTKGELPTGLRRGDGLYQVRVLVFRNFDPDPQSKSHLPVTGGDFSGLVAVGP